MHCQTCSTALVTSVLLLLANHTTATEPLLTLSAGQIGVDRALDNRSRYGIEYRFAAMGNYRLAPSLGLVATASATKYAYVDVKRDFRLGSSWYLTPCLGVVAFDGSEQLDLGLALEFRSGLELSYRLASQVRLGLAVYHLSNASLGDENPGTEEVVLTLSFPLR